MKVRDIMSAPVFTVDPDATFAQVVEQLLTHDVSGLPVVDPAGRLLGIVTEADLVSKEAYGYRRRRALGLLADYLRGRDPQWVRKASGATARAMMSSAPSACTPDEDVAVAARRMLEDGHKRLPVVEDGTLVGIVSRHDLLRQYCLSDGEIAAEVDHLLAQPLSIPEDHDVRAEVSDGVVTLTGTTRHPSDARIVEAQVARLPGVVSVVNEVTARESEPGVSAVPAAP
jgi:CBS domain-containing protein